MQTYLYLGTHILERKDVDANETVTIDLDRWPYPSKKQAIKRELGDRLSTTCHIRNGSSSAVDEVVDFDTMLEYLEVLMDEIQETKRKLFYNCQMRLFDGLSCDQSIEIDPGTIVFTYHRWVTSPEISIFMDKVKEEYPYFFYEQGWSGKNGNYTIKLRFSESE